MLASLGIICPHEHGCHITFLGLLLLFPPASATCFRRELVVSTSSTLEYRSVGNLHWMSGTMHEYDVNVYCEVLFRASQDDDGIRLEVTDSNLKPRIFGSNECLDKITVYDGSSVEDAVLGHFCGQEMPVFESSGNTALLVFETNKYNDDDYRGFILNYSSISRSGHLLDKSQSSVGAGTVALAVISATILYCVLFVVLYRRCKYAQRQVRRNLTMSGHTPSELRVTLTTVQDQTSLSQVSQGQSLSPQYRTSSVMPDILASVTMSSRPGSAHGQQRSGRVRHPAGDTYYQSQQPQPALLYSSHQSILNDNCSGYGSDRDEPYHSASSEIKGHIHHFLPPVFPPDPSGVFYAGNVDEHGILHPPGDQIHLATPVAPSVVSTDHIHAYKSHRQDDDRRSRESSQSCRSLYHGGRNSCSRDSSHAGSSGRCSPYRNRIHNSVVIYNGCSTQLVKNVDTEGQTFTFYGMIDGAGGAAAASSGDVEEEQSDSEESASSLHQQESGKAAPPPTYEDAATGKYSPHFSKN